MNLRIDIPGLPLGQSRPRSAVKDNHVTVYKESKSEDYESHIGMLVRKAAKENKVRLGLTTKDVPQGFAVIIVAYFEVPKSYSEKRRVAALLGKEGKNSKPDIDNIAKSVLDGISRSGLWNDDAQVRNVNAMKFWGEEAHCKVEIIFTMADEYEQGESEDVRSNG